ncbi:two component transcriptional regulator, LytTR family [Paenibacillus sp. CF095]|uniref:LytR/AlgR family response regulator transcription factor n=1 Tax=Paenibacillus sp. CF095 TaxID=1881033 RepID=UPI000891768B|nr:LytTR family DNA-binding domain-containing protein [Paenibacillus sp. CF095]SDD51735.1 two component transcriptional regulator, LytTR family [Paenibacillus sp. CF095]
MLFGGVCDDDKEIHEGLSQFFSEFERNNDCKFHLTYFSSGEELLEHYLCKNFEKFHFLFLDIEMAGINGLETAKQIRSLTNNDVTIIFLSSYPDYVMESFDVLTFQYLLKPLTYDVFESKMMRLCAHLSSTAKQVMFLKDQRGQNIVPISEIIAISKLKHSLVQNKLQVITTDQEFLITGTISSYSVKLGIPFLLVYRSVIVNMDYIRGFTANSVVTSNQLDFPISRTQIKQIKDTYAKYMAGKFII